MVGDEDVGAVAVDEVPILHLDFYTKEKAHASRPPLGWIVAPVVAIEEAPHDGDEACDDGEHQ